MPDDQLARWERELRAGALDGELYLAGERAGAAIASADWPHVARERRAVLSKGMQATKELFGARGIPRALGYWSGWVEGYGARRDALDRQKRP